MEITALVENTSADEQIGAQHGLSFFIQACGHNILFDMGQDDLFYKNAQKLNIDLADVDIAVLSHGHYDHGGGLSTFLEINKKAKVYLSRYAFEPYYNGEKYIGLDVTLKDNDRLVFVDDYLELDKGLTLYSCNDKERDFDLGSFGLSVKKDSVLYPDTFLHEQYLKIDEYGSRVLFSGCSHKGILNIATWFDVGTIIGGFHFSKLSLDKTLKSHADILKSFETKFITCHCTGEKQYEFLTKYMDNLSYIKASEHISI